MITRPLDLASRMRPEPRSFDWLFVVNAGLLVLFFSVWGSRFVLAPGLGLDFRVPEVAGAAENARATTEVISVLSSGQIFTRDGSRKLAELAEWLKKQRRGEPAPSLLVRVNGDVSTSVLVEIANAAKAAEYSVLLAAEEPRAAEREGGR